MPDKQSTSIERLTTAATALTALIVAFGQLSGKLKEIFTSLNQWWIWLVVAVLVLISLLMGRRSFARSRLLRSDALRLQRDRADHLKGREDDVERLASLCIDHRQVNLTGESGSGKSALVLAGLLPRLKDSPLVAIHVNSWGGDWEQGPRSTLALSLREHPSLAAAADAAEKQGRRPLVIFDQFDDYQNAHVARFRSAVTRAFISAEELTAANAFWREVRELLAANRIHCLFVTRADAAAGLESVRFAEPRFYPLDRLRPEAATEVLETLMKATDANAPVLSSPESGWPALRERLVRDLSREGAVLPIQMSLALKGLGNLPYLTVREYERHGGLHGLEAADIEWHAKNAARRAGIRDAEALAILCAMVDREAHKTRPRTRAELNAPAGLLEEWETKELLRRRVDPDTGDEAWSLDHDYLTGGVLAAEARASRASVTLRDAEQDHRASGGDMWRRWRTLLSPAQQIALLRDRVRGKFRYGERRRYALASLARFAPYALLLVVAALEVRRQVDVSNKGDAARLRDDFATEKRVETAWNVSRSSRNIRRHFINDGLRAGNAEQLTKNLDLALHAAIGFDRGLRDDVTAAARNDLGDAKLPTDARVASFRTIASLGEVTFTDLDAAARLPDTEVFRWAGNLDWHVPPMAASAAQVDAIMPLLLQRLDKAGAEESTSIAAIVHALLPHAGNSGTAAAIAYVDAPQSKAPVEIAEALLGSSRDSRKAHVLNAVHNLVLQPRNAETMLAATILSHRYGGLQLDFDHMRSIFSYAVRAPDREKVLASAVAMQPDLTDEQALNLALVTDTSGLETLLFLDEMQQHMTRDSPQQKDVIARIDSFMAVTVAGKGEFGIFEKASAHTRAAALARCLSLARESEDIDELTALAMASGRLGDRSDELPRRISDVIEAHGIEEIATVRTAHSETQDPYLVARAFLLAQHVITPATRDRLCAYVREHPSSPEAVQALVVCGDQKLPAGVDLKSEEDGTLAEALVKSHWPLPNDVAQRAFELLLDNPDAAVALGETHPQFAAMAEKRLDTAEDDTIAANAGEILIRLHKSYAEVAGKPTCYGKCLKRLAELKSP
jgi:hypothetical protein